MKPLWIAVCCCTASLLGLASARASAQQQPTGTQAKTAPRSSVQIQIGNFKFSPEAITVPAGAHLQWINRDDVPHVVIGTESGSPIKSPPLDTDDKYEVVLKKPGIYKYFCSLHPQMTGTVTVR